MDDRLIDDSGKIWIQEELDKVLARVDDFHHFCFSWAAIYPYRIFKTKLNMIFDT